MIDPNNKASPNDDMINTNDAMRIAESRGFPVTRPTMIKWIKDYGIGKKVFGRWKVDKKKLIWYLRYGQN